MQLFWTINELANPIKIEMCYTFWNKFHLNESICLANDKVKS